MDVSFGSPNPFNIICYDEHLCGIWSSHQCVVNSIIICNCCKRFSSNICNTFISLTSSLGNKRMWIKFEWCCQNMILRWKLPSEKSSSSSISRIRVFASGSWILPLSRIMFICHSSLWSLCHSFMFSSSLQSWCYILLFVIIYRFAIFNNWLLLL